MSLWSAYSFCTYTKKVRFSSHPLWPCDRFVRNTLHAYEGHLSNTMLDPIKTRLSCVNWGAIRVFKGTLFNCVLWERVSATTVPAWWSPGQRRRRRRRRRSTGTRHRWSWRASEGSWGCKHFGWRQLSGRILWDGRAPLHSKGPYQFSIYIQGIGFTSEQDVRVGLLLCLVIMSITSDDD